MRVLSSVISAMVSIASCARAVALVIGVGVASAACANNDLLDPRVAFSLSGQMVAPNQVLLRFRIAEGYYLYRDKIRVTSDSDGKAPVSITLPKGKVKNDEFFGRVEIYRGEVAVPVSVTLPKGAETLAVKVLSQGCADVGVCYPPQEQALVLGPKLGLVQAQSGPKKSSSESLLEKLKSKQ